MLSEPWGIRDSMFTDDNGAFRAAAQLTGAENAAHSWVAGRPRLADTCVSPLRAQLPASPSAHKAAG